MSRCSPMPCFSLYSARIFPRYTCLFSQGNSICHIHECLCHQPNRNAMQCCSMGTHGMDLLIHIIETEQIQILMRKLFSVRKFHAFLGSAGQLNSIREHSSPPGPFKNETHISSKEFGNLSAVITTNKKIRPEFVLVFIFR